MKELSLDDARTTYEEEHLTRRSFAPRTRREYLTDLTQLCKYLSSLGVSTVQRVQRSHLEGFLGHLDRQGLTGSTGRRKLAVMRSFFQFLKVSGYRTGNPAEDVIPPPLEVNQPRYLTQREYERLRWAARHEPRDAAIIELLLQTGLRLSELCRLRLTDVELPDPKEGPQGLGSVRIWHGRRYCMVTLNSKACETLRGHLLVRPAEAEDDKVFQTKFKRGIGPRGVELLVEKYLKTAGIHGASVHSLRQTFATHSVKRGTSLDVLQKALGHADRKTTAVYVDLARGEMDRQLQENAL